MAGAPCARGAIDIFISHDWGSKEESYPNLARAMEIAECLKELGYRVFIDKDNITPSDGLLCSIATGIQESRCFMALCTDQYVAKVNGGKANDLCKREFVFSFSINIPHLLVVMDAEASRGMRTNIIGLCDALQLYLDVSALDLSGKIAKLHESLISSGLTAVPGQGRLIFPSSKTSLLSLAVADARPSEEAAAAGAAVHDGPVGSDCALSSHCFDFFPQKSSTFSLPTSGGADDSSSIACYAIAHALQEVLWKGQHVCMSTPLGFDFTHDNPVLSINRSSLGAAAALLPAEPITFHQAVDYLTSFGKVSLGSLGSNIPLKAMAIGLCAKAVSVASFRDLITLEGISGRVLPCQLLVQAYELASDYVGALVHYYLALAQISPRSLRRSRIAADTTRSSLNTARDHALHALQGVNLQPPSPGIKNAESLVCLSYGSIFMLLGEIEDRLCAKPIEPSPIARRASLSPRAAIPRRSCCASRKAPFDCGGDFDSAIHYFAHAMDYSCECPCLLKALAARMRSCRVDVLSLKCGFMNAAFSADSLEMQANKLLSSQKLRT